MCVCVFIASYNKVYTNKMRHDAQLNKQHHNEVTHNITRGMKNKYRTSNNMIVNKFSIFFTTPSTKIFHHIKRKIKFIEIIRIEFSF